TTGPQSTTDRASPGAVGFARPDPSTRLTPVAGRVGWYDRCPGPSILVPRLLRIARSPMIHLPRLALATPSTGMEPSTAALAWLAGLTEHRWRVQHFRSRACPTGTQAVGQVTGLPDRHLDAWLMPEAVPRRLFVRRAVQAQRDP